MPGKPDFGAGGAKGRYFPGSKEYRAWDEGWRARYALQEVTANPINQTLQPVEYKAWNDGWNEADANSAGTRRMAATQGAPGVIPP